MKKYYTKTEVRQILENDFNMPMTYQSLCAYESKGFIKPSGYTKRGVRNMPIYTDKEIKDFLGKVDSLVKLGKIRINKK